MDFKLIPIEKEDVFNYKKDMQEAFQKGAMQEFNNLNVEILSEKDIEESLSKKGAVAYKAVVDGKMSGGVIVVIDETTQHNHLDFLYVKYGIQSKGIGQKIWNEVERLYPKTKVWETFTPYFEKRNVHFYINCLGFHAVEFFNPRHKDPKIPDDMIGGDYFFRFEKVME
ncbi:GNAT family N-acetyltransferase [Clostridioides difficile]|uniref:GNAT family N-acetyltransferase n=1 Tax=Clostridioides difficile TaxID=1496 RepID=UPI00202EAFAE|nr:GNAT family N-acetyltransferase [Clostridioides difficile]MCB4304440.1 GNAT family N-acetyltransferase [Clostridioides difficile]MCM0739909.1 GNAT family N-acetyltransferase [Clostridioides difficile]MCM0743275.1 GNAT family N-acetyltransferase [Clostridioides difficile]MCM0747087.1 GNAT family N-acetyltransferase [Clostridioides difficile]MCP8365318.1 GNAT family N-acetyltransferase [Clostridioides difficile]